MRQYDGGYGAWIPGPLLDDPGLRPRSLILYTRIARRANRVGFCYATNATLIDDMTTIGEDGAVVKLTERSIQAMLAELQARGHILTDRGPLPPDRTGAVRLGRRIYIGRDLGSIPGASEGGEENFTPEKKFTQGVKKTSPPFIGRKGESKYIPPIAPRWGADTFDIFWAAYPRHTAKERARKAWAKLNPDEALLDAILQALDVQRRSAQWTRDGGAFIPHPTTWLNGRRWEDELDAAPQSGGDHSPEVGGWET